MSRKVWYRLRATAFAVAFAAVSAWSTPGAAQTVIGQARAVQVTAVGTLVLVDTGTLGGTDDARDATLDSAVIPSMLSSEVLRAVTMGWPDQVASETSLASVNLAVGITGISADFVMARALAVLGEPSAVISTIENLSINGIPVAVTGQPNQRIPIAGGQVVINEQIVSPSGITVNAIHATVLGVIDVVIASATAGIRSSWF
jgi:hypothetical protein